MDGEGRILFVNDSARRAFERLGVAVPERVEELSPQLQAAIASSGAGAPEGGPPPPRVEELARGVWGVYVPIRELDPEWFQGMVAAEQMAAVGQLAATVAREIGGPNTSIQVTVDHLLERGGGVEEGLRESLGRILDQTERIARLTRQLISLADPGQIRLQSVDLNEAVEGACELVQSSFTAQGIALECEPVEGPLLARADRNHLLQVLVNLLLNARAVLQDWDGARRVRVRTARNTEWAYIHVEDTGPGVSREDASRIFLPFVSTTGGTGLGLYLTRQILVEQGGGIRLVPKNRFGGATFTIYLESATDE